MDTLARLIDRREPVSSLTPCQDVLRIFHEEPRLPALAILGPDHPLGLVYRDVFIGMMRVAGDALALRAVAEVMDPEPRCIDVSIDPHSFFSDLAAGERSVFRSSFVAVDADGGYVGIGGLGSLLVSHRRNEREAAEAMRATSMADLDGREEAEALVSAAEDAAAEAKRIEAARSHAKGDGRAIGLRTTYRPVMTDRKAALMHYLANRPDDIVATLQRLAEVDVREGKRTIPGFDVISEARV